MVLTSCAGIVVNCKQLRAEANPERLKRLERIFTILHVLDSITAFVVLALGILALYHVIQLPNSVTWSLIGAGSGVGLLCVLDSISILSRKVCKTPS